jgi:SAM-dependent methyltransferase
MPPPFLDLGSQPLANSYHDGSKELPRYPLAVTECRQCGHHQLTVAVDPPEMFQNYLYVSGTSCTMREYFAAFTERAVSRAGGGPVRVLDIGCNDGSLLEQFAPYASERHGVDPARNLAESARSKGISITTAYWSSEFSRAWIPRHDIIVAMNVFGHVRNPLDFLLGCKRVLAPGGRIYIQTSQCDWLKNGEFDCVYHEHLSYFTEESFRTLARRAGLHVESVERAPIHSVSWLFTVTDPLAEFTGRVERARDWTRREVEAARRDGYAVVGYGAAAKANTFLNYAGIKLDYIVDDNPMKWDHLTPGMDIPIYSTARLAEEEKPLALLLLAWNYGEEIVRNVQDVRAGKVTRFLRYFPTQEAFA